MPVPNWKVKKVRQQQQQQQKRQVGMFKVISEGSEWVKKWGEKKSKCLGSAWGPITHHKKERETVCPLSPSVQCRRRSQLWNRWPIDNQWRSVRRECHQQQCLSCNQKCRKQIAQKIWDANHTRTYTLSQYHSIACFEARRKVGCQRRVTRKKHVKH